MTAKKFASDSPILKASLDLAMTATLFDPDGLLVDHGSDILKMAKKAVPLGKKISAEQAHEYEWTIMMKDGGSFVWESKPLAELEAYVNGPKPAAKKKAKAPAKPEPVEFKRDAKIVKLSLDHATDGKAEDYATDGGYGENSIANLATAKRELPYCVGVSAVPFENGTQSLWEMRLSSEATLSWASKSLSELTELAAVPVKKTRVAKAS